eukprot:TRINITY_DN1101_c0_g2_i1.p1 TRINITY_DN1101_c0_g2~~TRINITY_DN1101_c0_g2_i1.p1  ORF type:complete len:268 (+),score=48.63 TRINITY_DN1101_c0_g2_i1:50-853(+)
MSNLFDQGKKILKDTANQIKDQFIGGGLFNQSQVYFEQDKHWLKPLCCLCVKPDVFRGKFSQDYTISEESTCFNRTCVAFALQCFQKEQVYKTDVGASNVLTVNQRMDFIAIKGMTQEVSDGHGLVGKVGMPRQMCTMQRGGRECVWDLVSWGSCSCNRFGVRLLSVYCCVFTNCRVFPTRIFDKDGAHLYTVSSKFLQCGPRRNFDIEKAGKEGPVGTITRIYKPECACFRPSSHFEIKFPQGADQKEKQLIFASALSLYYMYFDI